MKAVRTDNYKTESRRPPAPKFQYPCQTCLKKPGTESAQKKLCTASQHCKWHGGRYRCTLDERCKERLAKETANLKYKMESMPPGLTIRQIKVASTFLEEELEGMTKEDTKQPCWQNKYCPQDIGWHVEDCYDKLCESSHRAEDETWKEVVEKQEEFLNGKGINVSYNYETESEDETSSGGGDD